MDNKEEIIKKLSAKIDTAWAEWDKCFRKNMNTFIWNDRVLKKGDSKHSTYSK